VQPEDVPASWVQAADDNYSMHGHGLIRNILSGVAPLIAAAERVRILALLDAWTCPCGETGCSAHDARDRLAALIEETP
jgi:hypothetical protein